MKLFNLLLILLLISCKSNTEKPSTDPCESLTTITYSYVKEGQAITLYNVIDIVIGPETNYYLGSDFISERITTVTYLDTTCCCIKNELVSNKINILTNEKIE